MIIKLSDKQKIRSLSDSLEVLESRVEEVKELINIPHCQKLLDSVNIMVRGEFTDFENLIILKIEAIREIKSCTEFFEKFFKKLPPNIKKMSENLIYLSYLINNLTSPI